MGTENKFEEEIKIVLEKIRPSLQGHGGDISFVEANEATGKVYVELKGACNGCQGALITLKMGVEKVLKSEIPAVTEVIAVNM